MWKHSCKVERSILSFHNSRLYRTKWKEISMMRWTFVYWVISPSPHSIMYIKNKPREKYLPSSSSCTMPFSRSVKPALGKTSQQRKSDSHFHFPVLPTPLKISLPCASPLLQIIILLPNKESRYTNNSSGKRGEFYLAHLLRSGCLRTTLWDVAV